MNTLIVEELAKTLYEDYRQEVGGLTFNGFPLPTWEEFSNLPPDKAKYFNAWMTLVSRAVTLTLAPISRKYAELSKSLEWGKPGTRTEGMVREAASAWRSPTDEERKS